MPGMGANPHSLPDDDAGPLCGGIEAGGTKFVCAIGRGPGAVLAETRFPTTTPDETLGRAIQFFREHHTLGPLAAVGIASFGPVDPDPRSPTFGHITTTPKSGWAGADVAGAVGRALGVPVGFDTDVNGAALGEHRWGAARDLDVLWGLYRGTWRADGARATTLFPLWRHERAGGDAARRWSVLKGLIAYDRTATNRQVRFLWLGRVRLAPADGKPAEEK